MQNIAAAIERLIAQGLTQREADGQRSEWVALSVRKTLEDEAAWKFLETSNTRADAAAQARLDYQNAATAEAAITALTAASNCHIGRRTPFQVAAEWQKAQPPGPNIKEAHASLRLASRTPGPDRTDVKLPDDVGVDKPDQISREFARRRFFALQASPSLARLFRFVVDLECPVQVLDRVIAAAQAYPEPKAFDHDAFGRVAVTVPKTAPARLRAAALSAAMNESIRRASLFPNGLSVRWPRKPVRTRSL